MLRFLAAAGTLALLGSGLAFAQSYGGPCQVPDNGTGTVDLPPMGCGYLSPSDVHQIIAGLPPGTTINLAPQHERFLCGPAGCEAPGGTLGGNVDNFDSTLHVVIQGTGDLAGFHREFDIPVQCEVHTGPRTPGQPVQSFPTDMFSLMGGIAGDPDFATLTVTGGTANGMPSPGHTTLTRSGPVGSDFVVDSFFDITYRIDFVGTPGGALDGLSSAGGPATAIHMEAHGPANWPSFCDASDGALSGCPCANPGFPDTGCDNPAGTGGVKLIVIAQQTSPTNRATVQGIGYPATATPSSVVIRAPALDPGSPVVFGDGLRCIGVPLVRLGASIASGGVSTHSFGHGMSAPPGPNFYQLWYRSQPPMFCTPDAFNLSNGRVITW
jgi:hypothetical protein